MSAFTPGDYVYLAIELAIVIAGAVLAWRHFEEARTNGYNAHTAPLPYWEIRPEAFAFAAVRVLLTAFAVWCAAGAAMKYLAPNLVPSEGLGLIIIGGSFQLGLLAGIGVARAFLRPTAPWDLIASEPVARLPITPTRRIPIEGFHSFLIVCAGVIPVTLAWRWILDRVGASEAEQELVDVLRASDSPLEIVLMCLLAVVVAPVAEELVFRAGLFRYLRGRVPAVIAYAAPAAFFALIHFNIQALPGLFVLALLFAKAYERTGRIGVPIVAHALFNLHTVLQILLQTPASTP